MRKHDPRKWLHAVLDLLPVIFIPVFMVYSHRHTINDYQVQYSENKVVDFNQLFLSTNTTYGDYFSYNSYTYKVNNDVSTSLYIINRFELVVGHKYLYKIKSDVDNFRSASSGFFPYIDHTDLYNGYSNILTASQVDNNIQIVSTGTNTEGYSLISSNVIDLTQMFGSGNEPSIEQFDTWYPNEYYEYTTSHKELLKDYQTVTYNNTDIGSQLLYSVYTPVHDYMNFNNVFNFGQIYDWLQLNIFGGTAPMSVFIVWNIVLYEFLMDLIFLLYALFMFFIDFCTNLIDRFHTKCSGGK